ALASCVDGCNHQVDADRAACPRRGRGRDFCFQGAQLRGFLCRDECRDTLHVPAGLEECRQAFATCMNGCAVNEPTPTPTATAVRTERPPEPTAVHTEHPPEPTAAPTEHPPEPTMTPVKTSTPKPEATSTPLGPR